jgi:phosphate-selective porin OprO/OprP
MCRVIGVELKQKHIFAILGSIMCAQALAKNANEPFDVGATLILQREKYSGVLTDSGLAQSSSFLRRADIKVGIPLFDETIFNLKIKTKKSGKVAISDAYADLELIPDLLIRAGRYDPEFGHELTSSTNWTTAIERSAINDLLLLSGDGSGGEGISLIYSTDVFHGNFSVYQNTDALFFTSRIAYMTIPEDNHRLMFGYSATFTNDQLEDDGEISSDLGFWYLSDDEDVNSIKLAESLDEDVISDNSELGLELSYQYNNILFQSEYVRRKYDSEDGDIHTLGEGYFIQLAYTLTGESRRFKKSDATFRGIKPGRHDGVIPGAWEMFLRYEDLKVAQESNDRRATVNTIGLNWYYREDLRISSSYSKVFAPADDNDEGQISGSGVAFRILITL